MSNSDENSRISAENILTRERDSQNNLTNVVSRRKRLAAHSIYRNQSDYKKLKSMEVSELTESQKDNMSLAELEKIKRANFSVLGSTNGSIIKMPSANANNTAKPGDIKKLVIKNFKCKFFFYFLFNYFFFIFIRFYFCCWFLKEIFLVSRFKM